jgi:hypothetical protein
MDPQLRPDPGACLGRADHEAHFPPFASIMSFRLNPSAADRPAAPQDSAGTTSSQQPQPRSTAGTGSWLGWLHGLPSRKRNAPAQPQSPLGQLSPDLLHEVIVRTADADHPQAAARQLALLRPMNKALRDAADKVQQKEPAVQRAASEQRLAHAIGEATRKWRSVQSEHIDWTPAEDERVSTEAARITERLAATVRNLDPVIVDLTLFDNAGPVVRAFQEALSEHQNLHTLELAAREGSLLNRMTDLLDARPELLRSLDVRMAADY